MWHVGLVSVVLLNWLCDLGRSTWPQEVAIPSPSKESGHAHFFTWKPHLPDCPSWWWPLSFAHRHVRPVGGLFKWRGLSQRRLHLMCWCA